MSKVVHWMLRSAEELPTYYVDTATGNDTRTAAQAMNPATPWATLTKASATVPTTGGCQILMKPGTYAENSLSLGYFTWQSKTYAKPVIVKPWGAGTVTISNASGTTYCVSLSNLVNVTFNGLTFLQVGATTRGTIEIAGNSTGLRFVGCTINTNTYGFYTQPANYTQSVSFENCTFQPRQGEAGPLRAVWCKTNTGASITATFSNCTVSGIQTSATAGIFESGFVGASGMTCNVVISGGSYTNTGSAGYAVNAHGGRLDASNATFTSAPGPALVVGTDGAATYDTYGTITACTVNSATSHALLIGQKSHSITTTGTTATAGNYALVLKGTDSTTVSGSTFNGGTVNAVLFKGCTNTTVTGCTITNDGAHPAVGLVVNVAVKCQNVTLTNNRIVVTGATGVFAWGDSTADAGGGVCDYNTYVISGATGTARLGTVRTTANINDLATLQGAWSGYDVSGNDTHSVLA